MPFIPPASRKKLDPHLEAAALKIDTTGELNYAITKLCVQFWGDRNVEAKYRDLAEIMGTLECAKLEFYAQALRPLEDTKKAQHGQVMARARNDRHDETPASRQRALKSALFNHPRNVSAWDGDQA